MELMTVTLSDTLKYIDQELGVLYPENEIRSIRRIIFLQLTDIKPLDFHLKPNKEVDPATFSKIKEILDELKEYRPIQHILGNTEFLGMQMRVTPAVLIPRPETEEMTDWIIKTHKFNENRILDIGTGTGCIAIALDKLMLHSQTDAIDISDEALEIAEENSFTNESIVSFFKYDILQGHNGENFKLFKDHYDLIVSNPPYVTRSEMKNMLRNVLDYEPHIALFVEDQDPLIFYRAISDFARIKLEWGGFMYLEINPRFEKEIYEMLLVKGFRNIQIRKDLSGKSRIIRAQIKLYKKGDNPELEKVRQY